jgi:exosortase A-associated hydrolase 2
VPFFMDRPGGRLFAIATAVTGRRPGPAVLVCPAFAEEMNRTRRTLHLLGEALAARGVAMLNVDLHGTGDSAGDFDDSRWETWLDDLRAGLAWLRVQGCEPINLLGVRAGALLAWELLRSGGEPPGKVVLWQPVLTGKAVITDLLRARVAAAASSSARETVAELRGELEAGRAVEAAGYSLAPQLAQALDRAAVSADTGTALPGVCWIEIASDEHSAIRPAAVSAVESLRRAGATVDLRRERDPPFWSTTETTTGRDTVAATVRALTEAH